MAFLNMMLHLDEFFLFSFGWKKDLTIHQLALFLLASRGGTCPGPPGLGPS